MICLDETSRQLLADVRPPLPPTPGRPARQDPEYVRGGVTNIFLATEPLRGWGEVAVSDQRTRADFARFVEHLADVCYPDAAVIVLVLDQLNTHSPASLDAAFPPAEAKRLADKLEIHSTPKHGSWLNMAELELAVLQRQCLAQRVPDLAAMDHAVGAWPDRRNTAAIPITWQFTTAGARTKLRRLYRHLTTDRSLGHVCKTVSVGQGASSEPFCRALPAAAAPGIRRKLSLGWGR